MYNMLSSASKRESLTPPGRNTNPSQVSSQYDRTGGTLWSESRDLTTALTMPARYSIYEFVFSRNMTAQWLDVREKAGRNSRAAT